MHVRRQAGIRFGLGQIVVRRDFRVHLLLNVFGIN